MATKEDMEKIINKYDKKLHRLEKVIKQSDKQQLQMYKLYNTIEEQKKEIEKLYNYTIEQQKIAKAKLESLIVNDYKDNTNIVFKASDVLSGDYYSIWKLKNGATLLYILDGQGHGVSPALTIFAIASNMLQVLNQEDITFEYIVTNVFREVSKFLLENEQLSYTFVYIDKNFENLEYICGGMYPFFVKGDEVSKHKANNLPFMSFSDIPNITKVELNNFSDIIMYSDGLIEETDMDIRKYHPRQLIKDIALVSEVKEIINQHHFNDDVTLIHFTKPNSQQ